MMYTPGDHVLLIHNNATVLEMLASLLAEEGYQVSTSGYTADLASTLRATLPDLVLLDHSPTCEESCVDSLQQMALMRELEGVHVLVCSSLPRRVSELTAGLRYLPVNVLAKPFDIPSLLAQVEGLLVAPPTNSEPQRVQTYH